MYAFDEHAAMEEAESNSEKYKSETADKVDAEGSISQNDGSISVSAVSSLQNRQNALLNKNPSKVHSLDWKDVEARIKKICNSLLKPVAEMANNSQIELKREQVKLSHC